MYHALTIGQKIRAYCSRYVAELLPDSRIVLIMHSRAEAELESAGR